MYLIVCALHQALAFSICSSMDTNTSIMYEGPMSLCSVRAHIAAELEHMKKHFLEPNLCRNTSAHH